jgi:hypothetical protein
MINVIGDFELPGDTHSRNPRVSVKPGLDKLRTRHLKQLVDFKLEADNDEEFEFAERLASILDDILNDNIPREAGLGRNNISSELLQLMQ